MFGDIKKWRLRPFFYVILWCISTNRMLVTTISTVKWEDSFSWFQHYSYQMFKEKEHASSNGGEDGIITQNFKVLYDHRCFLNYFLQTIRQLIWSILHLIFWWCGAKFKPSMQLGCSMHACSLWWYVFFTPAPVLQRCQWDWENETNAWIKAEPGTD